MRLSMSQSTKYCRLVANMHAHHTITVIRWRITTGACTCSLDGKALEVMNSRDGTKAIKLMLLVYLTVQLVSTGTDRPVEVVDAALTR